MSVNFEITEEVIKKFWKQIDLQEKLFAVKNKRDWERLMCLDGAEYFPNLFARPIKPIMRNWRKLRKVLIRESMVANNEN